MRIHGTGILAALLVWFPGAAICSRADTRVQTFTLTEHFGVSHADQVVVFELQKKADPDHCHLLDDAGKEVPLQRV